MEKVRKGKKINELIIFKLLDSINLTSVTSRRWTQALEATMMMKTLMMAEMMTTRTTTIMMT